MELKKVQYNVSKEDRIAVISMDSPKNLNAFDVAFIDELVYALKLGEEDPDVRAVLINSTGRAFSAGGDIANMYRGLKTGELNFEEDIKKMALVSMTIKQMSKPVVAACNGAVAGAGFNMALACDYIVAAEDAVFMQAFVNIALVPDAGGFYLLTRAVGVNKAMELAMTGRSVSAQEGKQLGFVAQISTAEELHQSSYKAAKRFAAGPSKAFAQMKKLIWESDFKDFEAYVEEEVKSQILCGDTSDFKEGVSAFVEKRRPDYE